MNVLYSVLHNGIFSGFVVINVSMMDCIRQNRLNMRFSSLFHLYHINPQLKSGFADLAETSTIIRILPGIPEFFLSSMGNPCALNFKID